jgi:uncharacterized protein
MTGPRPERARSGATLRRVEITTAEGTALAELAGPADGGAAPAFLLVLTHGSGGKVATPDVLAVQDAGRRLGGVTALVTQPYRVKGRRAPGPVDRQDAAWAEVISALRDGIGADLPLVQGGRSNGARVACRTAQAVGARGVIALAFPLHPPGHPERSRAAELAMAGTDVLVINGRNDPFGIPRRGAGRRLVVLDGETHALSRHPDAVGRAARSWLRKLLG